MFTIAQAQSSDLPFLRRMLYQAAFWQPAQQVLPEDEALADPHLAAYLDGWGRPGDEALVAVGGDGLTIGAIWQRLFSEESPGYGFISPTIPEVSLAVVAEWRGKGAGEALFRALIDRATAAGFPALSLSVSKQNPARRLYARLGFVPVAEEAHPDGSITMQLALSPNE